MKNIIQLLIIFPIVVSLAMMQDKPNNLQVLEFDSERDLKKYMKTVSKDLGVKCKYCHDLNDKSIDTDHKIIAREMMRMQMDKELIIESAFSYIALLKPEMCLD